jgi:putative lipoic acid-binding regulatory protein
MTDDESLFKFPCEFPIKMMGRDIPAFREAVTAILREHIDDLTRVEFSERPSRNGRFVSINATIVAESRAQLDAIYRALSANQHVLVAL